MRMKPTLQNDPFMLLHTMLQPDGGITLKPHQAFELGTVINATVQAADQLVDLTLTMDKANRAALHHIIQWAGPGVELLRDGLARSLEEHGIWEKPHDALLAAFDEHVKGKLHEVHGESLQAWESMAKSWSGREGRKGASQGRKNTPPALS